MTDSEPYPTPLPPETGLGHHKTLPPYPLDTTAPYQAQETGKGVLWGGAFWGRFSLPPYPQNVEFVGKNRTKAIFGPIFFMTYLH